MADKENRCLVVGQLIMLFLLLASIGLNVYLMTKKNNVETVEKTVIRVVTDTVRDTIPEVRYETLMRHHTDTLRVIDTIPGDTVHVVAEIPIVRKEYSDDSTYTAWVSGYKPSLDSIDVYRKTVYVEKEIIKTRKNTFNVGPYVGFGYAAGNKSLSTSIGIGVTWSLFGF